MMGATQQFADFPRSCFAALQPEAARLVIRKGGMLRKPFRRGSCGFPKQLGPAQSFENFADALAVARRTQRLHRARHVSSDFRLMPALAPVLGSDTRLVVNDLRQSNRRR